MDFATGSQESCRIWQIGGWQARYPSLFFGLTGALGTPPVLMDRGRETQVLTLKGRVLKSDEGTVRTPVGAMPVLNIKVQEKPSDGADAYGTGLTVADTPENRAKFAPGKDIAVEVGYEAVAYTKEGKNRAFVRFTLV